MAKITIELNDVSCDEVSLKMLISGDVPILEDDGQSLSRSLVLASMETLLQEYTRRTKRRLKEICYSVPNENCTVTYSFYIP